MNTSLLITFILLAAACLLMIIFLRKKMNAAITPIVPRQMEHESNHVPARGSDFGCDLAIFDDNGFKILESREIEKIPERAHRVESSSSAINRVRHMAADLFKGAESVPNKTVEVIFKPEIGNRGQTTFSTASILLLLENPDE